MKEMYRIHLRENAIKSEVVCECCKSDGKINPDCKLCNGKGIHKKSFNKWEVKSRPVEIEKIDRCNSDSYYKGKLICKQGTLRYWEDTSCFFVEDDKLLHFTKQDAIKECVLRNKEVKQIIKQNELEVKRFKQIQDEKQKLYDTALGKPIIVNGMAIGVITKYNQDGRVNCTLWDRCFDGLEITVDENNNQSVSSIYL